MRDMELDDPWRYPRPDLATHYVARLLDAPARPLALFGPRQIGKTYFLTHDLRAQAEQAGLRSIYIDLWSQADPLGAINTALSSVLRALALRLGETAVTRVGALGVSVGLAAPAALAPAGDAAAWMAAQFAELRRLEPDRPVLMMLDEAQTLARGGRGDAAMKAVRALFNAHPGGLLLLLTGSSRSQLLALVGDHSRTAFKLAAQVDFPLLGMGFLGFVAQRYRLATGRDLALPELDWAFGQLLHRPGELIDFIRYWIADVPGTDLRAALAGFQARAQPQAAFEQRWAALTPLQQALLLALARDLKPFAADTRQALAAALGVEGPLPGGTLSRALQALEDEHLLAREGRGRYAFHDAQLQAWLQQQPLPAAMQALGGPPGARAGGAAAPRPAR
jgi:hypothetical protein